MAQRWAAKRAHERAVAASKALQLSETQRARKSLKSAEASARMVAAQMRTAAELAAIRAAQRRAWVPTDDELVELRKANGLPPPPSRKGRP